MAKKILSMTMAIIMLVSMLAITASAASYSTGTYKVSTSAGLNVRSGAGSGYSKVGAAANNTSFTVTKISGSWGYSQSIRCTNGTKSGWVCLDYCTRTGGSNSNRSTYNDVFASLKGKNYSHSQALASESTSFTRGDYIYVWGFLHDANNNLYSTYGSGKCDMTLSIYRPNGSLAFSYKYNNCSANWIGQKLDQTGTWKIQSKITGSLSGTNTRTITVKEASTTKWYTLTYSANGGSNPPAAQRVKANTGFYLSSSKPTRSNYTFLGWSTDKNATSASYAPGKGVKISSNITLYAVWKLNESSKTYVGYVNTSSSPLRLRKSASSSASVLTSMPRGAQVTVLNNKTKTNGYYKIQYTGYTGYASAEYISFTKPSVPSNGKLAYPVPSGCYFNKKTQDGSFYGYHDINRNVSTSTPVYAIANGTAVFKQRYAVIGGNKYLISYGNYVEFTSSDGVYKVIYGHLNKFNGISQSIPSSMTRQMGSSAASAKGYKTGTITMATRTVSMGDILGYIGTTGNSTGNHLHIEIYKNGVRIDPTSIFPNLKT